MKAKQISGDDHYLFTRTSILYDRYVPPRNATDAALDAAQAADVESDQRDGSDPRESRRDRPGVMTVEEPLFVLGFLDVTGPFIVAGGLVLAVGAWIQRRRDPPGRVIDIEPPSRRI